MDLTDEELQHSIRSRVTNGHSAIRRGFTVIEIIVAMVVGIALVGGVLTMFQLNTSVARVQTHVADLQQSVRVAQYHLTRQVRMAGRGGLPSYLRSAPTLNPPFPGKILPEGAAFEVRNNVPDGATIGGQDSPRVVPGTDVLTVRGVISTPIYQISPSGFDPNNLTVTVQFLSPTGVPQDLTPLQEAVTAAQGNNPEALILVSPVSRTLYAVVEIAGGTVVTGSVDGNSVPVIATLNLRVSGSAHTSSYLGLTPDGRFPPQLTSVGFIGLLEEYRYYVREVHAIPNDASSELLPRLSRARFYPFTQTPHLDNPNSRDDIASNVLDLQIAFGVDTDGDGLVFEGEDDAGRLADEWLFNSPDDLPDDPDAAPGTWRWNGVNSTVFYLRIDTLARSRRPDPRFRSPALASIEDHIYNEPESPQDEPQRLARMHRRRLLQTTIDLRNL